MDNSVSRFSWDCELTRRQKTLFVNRFTFPYRLPIARLVPSHLTTKSGSQFPAHQILASPQNILLKQTSAPTHPPFNFLAFLLNQLEKSPQPYLVHNVNTTLPMT